MVRIAPEVNPASRLCLPWPQTQTPAPNLELPKPFPCRVSTESLCILLCSLRYALTATPGCPPILDAHKLNSYHSESGAPFKRNSERPSNKPLHTTTLKRDYIQNDTYIAGPPQLNIMRVVL